MIPSKPRFRQRIVANAREGDDIEPGDVIVERGPRIGERWWVVVDTVDRKVWRHIYCERLASPAELTAQVIAGGRQWYVGKCHGA